MEVRDPALTRRNFRLGVLNGLLFTVTDRLMEPNVVVASFVGHLTASPVWVGLVLPITDGGWFLPQFWMAGWVQAAPRKIDVYRQGAVVRAASWVLLVASVAVLRHPGWLLAAFLVTYTATSLTAGLNGLPFLEVVAKVVPPQRRAEFFAWRLALGGLAGLLGAGLVGWLLGETSPLSFPLNFAVLFGAAYAFGLVGLVALSRVSEPREEPRGLRLAWHAQFRRARGFLRTDAAYRHYLVLRIMLMLASSAVPFFAVFVQQRLQGPLAAVGAYLAASTLATLLAHGFFGRFGARLGNRRILAVAGLMGGVMALLVLGLAVVGPGAGLSGWAAAGWLLPVFVLNGVRESAIGVASHSLLLDVAPAGERSLYLGFTHSLLGGVVLATGLTGVLVGVLGYAAVFAGSLLAHGVALWTAQRMAHVMAEPEEQAPPTNAAAGLLPAGGEATVAAGLPAEAGEEARTRDLR